MWTDSRLAELNKLHHDQLLAEAERKRLMRQLRQGRQPQWKREWQRVRASLAQVMGLSDGTPQAEADRNQGHVYLALGKAEAAE